MAFAKVAGIQFRREVTSVSQSGPRSALQKTPTISFSGVVLKSHVLCHGNSRSCQLLVWLMCLAMMSSGRDFFFLLTLKVLFLKRHRLHFFTLKDLFGDEYQDSLCPLKKKFYVPDSG